MHIAFVIFLCFAIIAAEDSHQTQERGLPGLNWDAAYCPQPATVWLIAGDRYVLKLFRDFVFHQSTEEGLPDLSRGHIIEALNKVDAGVPEQITLLSRDEASIMVVSYADIKRCIDSVYAELQSQAATKTTPRLRTPHR